MNDEHRAPGDGDRKPVRDRIARALADGRISAADAEIRLANVANAQSLTELSLLTRDLDQIEAAAAAARRAAEPTTTAAPTPSYAAPVATRSSSGRLVPLLILGLVLSLVVAGGIALFVFSASDGKDEIGVAPQQEQVTPGAPRTPGTSSPGGGEEPSPAVVRFERTAEGIKEFLATYRKQFSTTRATELTMYSDYAIVRVPVPGKKRDAGWIYRDGAWSEFGGVRATMLGAESVDLARLDVAALIRNMAKAERTLKVEDPEISHVSIDFRSTFDDVPNVRIYASNEFSESGYLATDLRGKILRSYPYDR